MHVRNIRFYTSIFVVVTRAVEILKNCAKTDKISFIISRSDQSRSEFRRLSGSPVKGIRTILHCKNSQKLF